MPKIASNWNNLPGHSGLFEDKLIQKISSLFWRWRKLLKRGALIKCETSRRRKMNCWVLHARYIHYCRSSLAQRRLKSPPSLDRTLCQSTGREKGKGMWIPANGFVLLMDSSWEWIASAFSLLLHFLSRLKCSTCVLLHGNDSAFVSHGLYLCHRGLFPIWKWKCSNHRLSQELQMLKALKRGKGTGTELCCDSLFQEFTSGNARLCSKHVYLNRLKLTSTTFVKRVWWKFLRKER